MMIPPKLICDRCKKGIENPKDYNGKDNLRIIIEFSEPVTKMITGSYPMSYDICPDCLNEIKKFLSSPEKKQPPTEQELEEKVIGC